MERWLPFAALLAGLLLQITSGHDVAPRDPVVHTPLGAVRGTTMMSRSGRTFFAFRGMRYAKPPVGELRFKVPLPITEGWNEIKNATEDGASCPQVIDLLSGPTSEDCLFLNVYSPKLPNREETPSYPVMFFIHPGGWGQLSGQSTLLGPMYLMDEDIVFVAINYRLGVLGFLSTGDSEVPGNNGLKDQLLALKWVRDNIVSFGGNPDLVTLWGSSTGAATVQYHMASPRSAGLFHHAISSSPLTISGWSLTRDQRKETRMIAQLLNCPHNESATSKQIVDCLKTKEAEDIAKPNFKVSEPLKGLERIPGPVIEAEGSSEEPFLTEDPRLLFQTGNFAQVPWLTGTTNNEMMHLAAQMLSNDKFFEGLLQNFEHVSPIQFHYEKGSISSLVKARKLREFYFPGGHITKDSLQPITDMYTDGVILHAADRSVKLASATSTSPVYYYQFVYRGRFGQMPNEPGMDKVPGPVHQDDISYILFENETFPFITNEFPEAVISKRLVRMWANFARTGNPTPDAGGDGDGLITTTWLPHTPAGLEYMEIGDDLIMKQALRQERVAIWDYIYPLGQETDQQSDTHCETE